MPPSPIVGRQTPVARTRATGQGKRPAWCLPKVKGGRPLFAISASPAAGGTLAFELPFFMPSGIAGGAFTSNGSRLGLFQSDQFRFPPDPDSDTKP